MKLTPIEIITLASIVDEETANNGEKPMIYKKLCAILIIKAMTLL